MHVGFVLAGGQGGGEPGLHVGFVLAGGHGGGEPGLHVGCGIGLQLGLIEPGWQGGGGTGLQLGLIEPGWQGGIIGRLPLPFIPVFVIITICYIRTMCSIISLNTWQVVRIRINIIHIYSN